MDWLLLAEFFFMGTFGYFLGCRHGRLNEQERKQNDDQADRDRVAHQAGKYW